MLGMSEIRAQGEAVEPSDYYPDAYYRDPPEDPRSQELPGRVPGEVAHRETPPLIRHEGYGEHLHVRRIGQDFIHRRNPSEA
jgi:hypothetical protein